MVDGGILDEDDRIELIDGELIAMSPKSDEHEFVVGLLQDLLTETYGRVGHVRVQGPMVADDMTMPEPDLLVARGSRRASPRHPRPPQVILVVEVANSSFERDREKAAVYARSGVPEYWIVDVVARCVEVLRVPVGDAYTVCRVMKAPDALGCPEVDASIAIADFLG